MNRRIPSGAYCVFQTPVEGSRSGRVLLVQHHEISDPDTGGSYAVKIYDSTKAVGEDRWQHERITLRPDPTAAGYDPIVLTAEDHELQAIADLVRVLPGPST
jgi:hypothetical protein